MAINTVTIQVRRGNFEDFDMSKMRPGELAVILANDPSTTSGKSIYFTTSAGVCKRLMTYEDLENEVYKVTGELTAEIRTEIEAAMAEIGIEENQRQEAEAARVIAESTRAAAEIAREQALLDKIAEVDEETAAAIERTDTATAQVNDACADAVAATGNANATAAELIRRANAGEFDGKVGPEGPPGESGVTTQISGFFTLSGDADGNLYANYADNDSPPRFEVDPETNDIYYITPDS